MFLLRRLCKVLRGLDRSLDIIVTATKQQRFFFSCNAKRVACVKLKEQTVHSGYTFIFVNALALYLHLQSKSLV